MKEMESTQMDIKVILWVCVVLLVAVIGIGAHEIVLLNTEVGYLKLITHAVLPH